MSLKNGEMLECVGGPLHGQLRAVAQLFPWCDAMPSTSFVERGLTYTLDHAGRRWVFGQDVGPGDGAGSAARV